MHRRQSQMYEWLYEGEIKGRNWKENICLVDERGWMECLMRVQLEFYQHQCNRIVRDLTMLPRQNACSLNNVR